MFRCALCLPFVLACGLPADEKPAVPKASPLMQGTVKVQGENLICVVYMRRNVEKEVDQTVFEGGKAVTVKRKYTVVEAMIEQRILPLKGLQGHVVGAKAADPTKALRPLDLSNVPELVEKDRRGWFILAGEDLTVDHLRGLKAGTVIFVLPKEEKKK